jgi:hypothetical protein
MNAYLRGVDALGARHAHAYDEEPADDLEAAAARALAEAEAAEPQQMTSFANAEGGRTVDGGGPPLALLPPFEAPRPARVLKSEIDGIPDRAWTDFVLGMKTQDPGAVSASNELGMFSLKARRLADLGLLTNLTNARSPMGRMVWVGEWKAPLTQDKFLGSPKAQYAAFCTSMRRYVAGLKDGSVAMPDDGLPDDLTLSGVLGVLHRCGPSGLRTWNDEEDRFPSTVALVDKVNGIF